MSITAIGSQLYPHPSIRPERSTSLEDAAKNHPRSPKAEPDLDKYVPSDEEPRTEMCTVNTDKVDAEIRKLKKEKENLQQQIRRAADDPEKRAKLEQKLSQIEMELNQKDNDTYRKQHAVYTNS